MLPHLSQDVGKQTALSQHFHDVVSGLEASGSCNSGHERSKAHKLPVSAVVGCRKEGQACGDILDLGELGVVVSVDQGLLDQQPPETVSNK